MDLKRLILIFLCITGLAFCSTSCSSDDDDDNNGQLVKENDWMLEGTWEIKDNVSEDDNINIKEITFRTDGTGSADGKELRWYTYDGQLFICFNGKKQIKEYYSISGATLQIANIGTFVTQLPITGTWYACNAMREFNGNTFCYYFNENGDGIRYTFDYMGLSAKTFFRWNRSHEGISFIYTNSSEDKSCSFSDNTLNIDGEGCFTSSLPYYGSWKAVDSNEGLIFEGDNNFSTLDIYNDKGTNYFVCNYKTLSDDKYIDSYFQGNIQFVTSHQQYYDDQRIFIIQDVTGTTDAKVIDYRFFYFPPRKKVYLDLSHSFKEHKFVRYELD